ncbi:MAG: hypothetical protein AABY22_34755 [Nanoarchaeota archaeon]
MINIKNLLLGIAIFILTIFVGIYGISTLYGESPEYDDYCPSNIHINQSICESEGGVWINNSQIVSDVRGAVKTIPAEGGSCNYDYTPCQKEWEDAQEKYYKKVFLTALPIGIVIIIAGALIFGLEVVGAGLMAGGLGIIIYGTGQYWRFTDDWLKFILSFVGLIIVVWLAYYWNKRWNKK